MRQVFLLVYSDDLGTREQVKKALDTNPHVVTWRYDLPNAFYVVSDVNARQLAESIRAAMPKGRFFLTVADKEYWGWNYDATWYLLTHKKHDPNLKS